MRYFLILFSLLTFCFCSHFSHAQTSHAQTNVLTEEEARSSWICERLNTEDNRKLLDYTFRKRSTVGVIPIYWINKELIVLLSREKEGEGSDPKKAGQYCDFGGKAEIGETILTAAAREYKEESMGELELDPKRLKDAFLLKGRSPTTGLDICYIIYPLSLNEYELSLRLNEIWGNLKDRGLPDEYREKDRFFWFLLSQVLKKNADQSFDLKPLGDALPEGDAPVTLRMFLKRDFLSNHLLPALIQNLNDLHAQSMKSAEAQRKLAS